MTSAKAGSGAEPAFVAPADETEAQLWIVRHGETEWSRSGKHTSVTDIPLTEAGERQAAALRPVLDALGPARVLSSPRQRALRTAELAGLTVDEITEDLAEWNYGADEGRTTAEIRETIPGWTIFANGATGGESVELVGARADRVLARARVALAEGPVVLVGHGHFSRVLGARWIGMGAAGGAALMLGTAAPCVLGAEHGVPALVHWNLPNPAEGSS